MKKVLNGVVMDMTAAEIAEVEVQEVIEQARALEEAKTQYQRDREEQYPSIGEQLDMMYWDGVNGTTTWSDAIAQVKADNPKPTE